MPVKKEIKEARRRQILDAAEKVFVKRGIDKARMDDIVQESGLSKGALYWYFKSKDEIILALMERMFVGEMKEAEDLVAAGGAAGQRLQLLFKAAVSEIRHFEQRMPLGYEFFSLAAHKGEVREAIRGYYRRYQAILSQIIQQGIDSGELIATDPDDAAVAAIGIVEGMALMWFLDPEILDWDHIGDLPAQIFIHGLEKRES